MVVSERIRNELLNSLNMPFSYARWEPNPDGREVIVVEYSEDTNSEVVFRVVFRGLTAANADVARFIANALTLGLEGIYDDLWGEDWVVSTSGFRDACTRIVERNADLAREKNLEVKVHR